MSSEGRYREPDLAQQVVFTDGRRASVNEGRCKFQRISTDADLEALQQASSVGSTTRAAVGYGSETAGSEGE